MCMRKKLSMVVLLSGVLAAAGCTKTDEPVAQESSMEPEMSRPAVIETVYSGFKQPDFAYIGTVRAARKADLSFESSGKLISLLAEEGDQVEKGQIIAEMDKTTLQNNYKSALVEYQKAKKDTERLESIYKSSHAISLSDLEKSRTQLDIVRSKMENQKEALDNNTLKAPFDGIIASRKVQQFSFVQAKETIFTLQNLDKLEVAINIPGSAILTAREDVKLAAVFDQLPERKFPVAFKYIATEGDRRTQTYRVILSLPETDKVNILPGMSVTVIPDEIGIARQGTGVIFVPLRAITSDGSGNKFVWKVQQDNRLTKTIIETGALEGDDVIVLNGLADGDRIVTAGVSSLVDHMKVRPLDQE